MLEPFLCLFCIFLTLLSVLSATLNCASFLLAWCSWSLPSFGYGLSLPAVVCHAVHLFSSQPVLECLVWISEVPSAHTNTFIYVFVQKNIQYFRNLRKTTSCIYLSISYLFLIVSFALIFHMSYISFVLQCPKIKFT